MKIAMRLLALLGTLAALTSVCTPLFDAAGQESHPEAYPTRCVRVTLPPDGTPLPEVCLPYPL